MTPIDWIIIGVCRWWPCTATRRDSSWARCRWPGSPSGRSWARGWRRCCSPRGRTRPTRRCSGSLGALLVGVILAVVLEGFGVAVRRRLRVPGARDASTGSLGAVLSACVALGARVARRRGGAAGARAPRPCAHDIQRSPILRALNASLPPSGPILNALARFDPFPQIDGPQADVPRRRSRRSRATRRCSAARDERRARARHRLRPGRRGLGLGRRHRRRGDQRPRRRRRERHDGRGRRRRADARRDGGRLRPHATTSRCCACAGLRARALAWRRDPRRGAAGAVLGFPQNGPFDVRAAARLGTTQR